MTYVANAAKLNTFEILKLFYKICILCIRKSKSRYHRNRNSINTSKKQNIDFSSQDQFYNSVVSIHILTKLK